MCRKGRRAVSMVSTMREWAVDLYSDTKTRPTVAMRKAIAEARVGDAQQDEDPTVAELTSRVAAMLGKDAALFLPSGTMANVASVLVHCRPGDEILADVSSHVLHFETGGPAGIAAATVTPVAGEGGIFSPKLLIATLRPERRNAPRPRLIWIEQTTNMGGGRVWPLNALQALSRVAQERGLALHIDGARLLNATIAASVSPAQYGAVADSVWIDFTKGLGAPFGAVLAGSRSFIEEARRFKHMLGGAMRQAGMMAAGCLYALDHHVERLAQDHAAARALAEGLAALPGLRITNPVETNIVILDVEATGLNADIIADKLSAANVRVGVFGPAKLRLITHLDVPDDGVGRAVDAFRRAIAQ